MFKYKINIERFLTFYFMPYPNGREYAGNLVLRHSSLYIAPRFPPYKENVNHSINNDLSFIVRIEPSTNVAYTHSWMQYLTLIYIEYLISYYTLIKYYFKITVHLPMRMYERA